MRKVPRMSGDDLKNKIAQLGISEAEFSRQANISEPTLRKICRNDPRVRPAKRGRALAALQRLENERQSQADLKPAS